MLSLHFHASVYLGARCDKFVAGRRPMRPIVLAVLTAAAVFAASPAAAQQASAGAAPSEAGIAAAHDLVRCVAFDSGFVGMAIDYVQKEFMPRRAAR
jgi:hypothetical protein